MVYASPCCAVLRKSAQYQFCPGVHFQNYVTAVGELQGVIDGEPAHLGSGTLHPHLTNERDKDYERNASAALLSKTRQVYWNGLQTSSGSLCLLVWLTCHRVV